MTGEHSLDAASVALDPVLQGVLALVVAVMMFSVALSLKLADFRFLKTHPRMFFGGAAAQLLGLPLLTLGLIALISPPPSVALGMIVVACCPGGNMSNVFTHLARGHIAYSVSLTAFSSTLAAVLMPVAILFWAGLYAPTAELLVRLELEVLPFLARTMLLLALPLAAGMVVRARWPSLARAIRPAFTTLTLIGLAAVILFSMGANWGLFLAFGMLILPLAMLHNAAALGLGAAAGRALRLDAPGRRALTFEVGIQNAGLGLVILLSQFQGLGGAAAITAIWGVWHLVSGAALAGAFRLRDHQENRRLAAQSGE
ncbi:MAG: bile acid:sodium symporter family protein [Maricaulaceae bacterium]|nr:bile acid:sodium symporter family protein [Maricaulaceae bacterium]